MFIIRGIERSTQLYYEATSQDIKFEIFRFIMRSV